MIEILYILANIIRVILTAYCVFSWIIRDPFNKAYRFLCMICDPVLNPIRSVLSRISFLQSCPIDFSPLVLLLLISIILP